MIFNIGDIVRLDFDFDDSEQLYQIITKDVSAITFTGLSSEDCFVRIEGLNNGNKYYCSDNSITKIVNYYKIWKSLFNV